MTEEKVFLYARTSTNGQQLGLDKQLQQLGEHAELQSYEVVGRFSTHVSGMKTVINVAPKSQQDKLKTVSVSLDSRPVLQQVYRKAQKADVNKLLLYDPSRLARRMRTELILEHLFEEIDVEVEYLQVSDSWIGKQISTLINEYEVRQTRERTKRALQQKEMRDEWKGRPPTGFKTVDEHNKLEPEDWLQDAVQKVREYKATGLSRRELAEQVENQIVTASKLRSLENNMEQGKPEKRYVKGERAY